MIMAASYVGSKLCQFGYIITPSGRGYPITLSNSSSSAED